MINREKVIKGLCEAIGTIHGFVPKRYWGYGEQACRDAIALIAAQHKLILELQNLISAGTKMMNGGEVGMSRAELIKKFSDYVYYFKSYCTSDNEDHEMLKAVLALLKEQEIVRCKDCQHGEKVNSVYLCGKIRGFGIAHEPGWFCADGERKEGAVNQDA